MGSSGRPHHSELQLQTRGEQVVGLPPQAHRPGIRRQVRRQRFAERTAWD